MFGVIKITTRLQIGGDLWDGAVILMKYLEKRFYQTHLLSTIMLHTYGAGVVPHKFTHRYCRCRFGEDGLKGKRVIDLGAGTGAVGIACALQGARAVTITDVGDILFLARRNVKVAFFPILISRIACCVHRLLSTLGHM